MKKKLPVVSVILFLLLCLNCSSIKTITVPSYNYSSIKGVNKIFVTVKSGEKYELVDFEITENSIKGTSIIRSPDSKKDISKEEITILRSSIEFVEISKDESTKSTLEFTGGCLIGFFVFFLIFKEL